MTTLLLHPGANPKCRVCLGVGLQVEPAGAYAQAVPCACTAACPRCHGTLWVADGVGLRPPMRRCDCFKVDLRRRAFAEAQVPARYATSTFASFKRSDGNAAAWTAARNFAEGWTPGVTTRGLVLHGDVGRGKTHLLAAIVRSLVLRHGLRARFIEFTHLLADLKLSFERGTTGELLEPLAAVDVLAIDELGKGRNTEFEGTVLEELVSRRYNAGKMILGTTNYAPRPASGVAVPNLADLQGPQPTLGDRVSDRVFSRLTEMCDFVPVLGEDHRTTERRARRGGAAS
jgi:DNA replication protein DnaC